VRADGGEEDSGDIGVDQRAAGRERVCGGAGGGREDTAIGLDDCEQVVVAVEFELGDVGGGASVDDQFYI
jgi:hypothetical protein